MRVNSHYFIKPSYTVRIKGISFFNIMSLVASVYNFYDVILKKPVKLDGFARLILSILSDA